MNQFIYISSLGRIGKNKLIKKYIVKYNEKNYDNRDMDKCKKL